MPSITFTTFTFITFAFITLPARSTWHGWKPPPPPTVDNQGCSGCCRSNLRCSGSQSPGSSSPQSLVRSRWLCWSCSRSGCPRRPGTSLFKTIAPFLYHTVVGEGLSPPSSLLRVNPSPTSSRSRSLRSSAPKVSSWVCRSLLEGLFDALLSDTGVNGSSFRPVGEGKPPEMGGSPPD